MNNCKKLAELIENNKVLIENNLTIYHAGKPTKTTYTWEYKLDKLKSINDDILEKEEIWTFIIICAYAYSGRDSLKGLASLLCQSALPENPDYLNKVCIEYETKAPRKGVKGAALGNSEIDLAMGCIDLMTKHMIHYKPVDNENDWICFAEMKFLDDIDVKSGKNPIRNQLIRIIEDAITFQKHDEYLFPKKVYVTLVTPALFKNNPESRLYGLKFSNYKIDNQNNVKAILSDINQARMKPRTEGGWAYPENITERIENDLILHWVTLEDMINHIPDDNPFKSHIENLYVNIQDLIQNNQVN